ncbi:uL13 family ribosomal protein [Candidatus Vidania fulgoroideorum]
MIFNLKGLKIGRVCTVLSKNIIDYILIKKNINIVIKRSYDVLYKKDSFFYKHTGYPGGIKKIKNSLYIKNKGMNNYIKKTLIGMLPKKKKYKNIVNNIIFE